jgi:hypothetical protein
MPDRIEEATSGADLEIEPRDNFYELEKYIEHAEEIFFGVDFAAEALEQAKNSIETGVATVSKRKELEHSDQEWEGADIAPTAITVSATSRSVFSDVDD